MQLYKSGQYEECPAETTWWTHHANVGRPRTIYVASPRPPRRPPLDGVASRRVLARRFAHVSTAATRVASASRRWPATRRQRVLRQPLGPGQILPLQLSPAGECTLTGKTMTTRAFWVLWGHPQDKYELTKRTGLNPVVRFPSTCARLLPSRSGGDHGDDAIDARDGRGPPVPRRVLRGRAQNVGPCPTGGGPEEAATSRTSPRPR